jgi:hypothetical protein
MMMLRLYATLVLLLVTVKVDFVLYFVTLQMSDTVGGDELHGGGGGGENGGVGGHVDMKPSAEYLMGLGYGGVGGGGGMGRKDGTGAAPSSSSSSAAITAYPPPTESPANSGTNLKLICLICLIVT